MPGRWSPTVVGAPRLKRYQVFGNLFAAVDGVGYRLDRHPTMSRHPVTPMDEADLRRHLAAQTARRIELIDMVQLRRGRRGARRRALQRDDVPVVLIDVLDDETLLEAGRLVWEQRGDGAVQRLVVGPALRAGGALARDRAAAGAAVAAGRAARCRRLRAVSGSCSPVTAAQIAVGARATASRPSGCDWRRRLASARARPRSSASSPSAARGARPRAGARWSSAPKARTTRSVRRLRRHRRAQRACAAPTRRGGRRALAEVMRRLLDRVRLRRVVVAGGDSSGEVASALDIQALTVRRGWPRRAAVPRLVRAPGARRPRNRAQGRPDGRRDLLPGPAARSAPRRGRYPRAMTRPNRSRGEAVPPGAGAA